MQFNFLKYKYIYFVLAGLLVAGSLAVLVIFGLNMGIDFTGGSIMELEYEGSRPALQAVRDSLSVYGEAQVQTTGENGLIIRMGELNEPTHQEILEILKDGYELEEMRFESIGPVIGKELENKTKTLILLALFSIVVYIAFAFRKVQRPIRSWQYGLASLIALFHDVVIPMGIFSLLGYYYGVQFTIPVVTALLTVLGYSINNTVVVFDRIREALIRGEGTTFEETINISLNRAFTRCINTSLTTLMVLLAIYFFGGETLKYFSLALIIGITAGTFSSLFLAAPILAVWIKWKNKIA
jgi:preprotein translocase subunit SecF